MSGGGDVSVSEAESGDAIVKRVVPVSVRLEACRFPRSSTTMLGSVEMRYQQGWRYL